MFLEVVTVKLKLLVATLVAASSTPAIAASPTVCQLQDSRITESSGVAVAGNVIWTHNDSGDTARFFALDRRCRTIGTYNVTNEKATDWEDMTRNGSALWFGDIGDNASTRKQIQVVKVLLPKVTHGEHAVRATVFRFVYADGAHDAEALLIHPKTGRLFIVTKTYYGMASVYAAPLNLSTTSVNTFTKVGSFLTHVTGHKGGPLGPAGQLPVTSGDINASATRVVVRTYTDAYEWTVTGGDVVKAFSATPTVTALPQTKQGEAIAYDTDGKSWITTSEGKGAPVDRIAR